mgnify:CR=1 FL=1
MWILNLNKNQIIKTLTKDVQINSLSNQKINELVNLLIG